MYQQAILSHIYRAKGLNAPAQQEAYLQNLQPLAKQLWSSYREDHVQVDYSNMDVQAIYMLRYYPAYSEILPYIFSLSDYRIDNPHFQVAFFGAGPAPELYGLVKYLLKFKNIQSISTRLYDIAANEWDFSRNITMQNLIPDILQQRFFTSESYVFDIRQPQSINSIPIELVIGCDLFVFQNCLNELGENSHNNAIENIILLLRRASQGSVLVVIDRSGYGGALSLIESIERIVINESLGEVLKQKDMKYCTDEVLKKMPDVVKNNLFFGVSSHYSGHAGLILAKSIKYHSILIQKA